MKDNPAFWTCIHMALTAFEGCIACATIFYDLKIFAILLVVSLALQLIQKTHSHYKALMKNEATTMACAQLLIEYRNYLKKNLDAPSSASDRNDA